MVLVGGLMSLALAQPPAAPAPAPGAPGTPATKAATPAAPAGTPAPMATPAPAGAPATPAAAPVDPNKVKFDLRFEAGKSFYQKYSTRVEQTIKMQAGTDTPMKQEMTFFFKWTPVSQDKDKWTVKQTIEGVKFSLSIAGQSIDYDSTDSNPTGAAGNPALSEFFKNLINLEFSVTFGPGGVVEKVEGKDEAVKKLSTVNPQLENILKNILSDDALKEMTDPTAGLTPKEAIALNGTWEKTMTTNLGPIGSYERKYNCTYKGKDADPTKKDLDRVEIKPTISYKPPLAGTESLPFRIKSGSMTTKEVKQGYMLYNAKSGRPQEIKIQMIMEGDLDVTIGAADTKVKLYQDQTTEYVIGDTSFMGVKK
jgi:hypothetical protein